MINKIKQHVPPCTVVFIHCFFVFSQAININKNPTTLQFTYLKTKCKCRYKNVNLIRFKVKP